MKKEQLFEAIGGADDKFLNDSEREDGKYRIKKNCLKGLKVAACFMAAVLSIFVLNAERNKIPLSDISKGVKAKYIDKAPKIKESYCLEYFTEEELFFKFDVVILKGIVKKLNNIQLNFNGEREYRAIGEIHDTSFI